MTEKLNGMFEVQEAAVDEATANDMTRAYARLLSAASLTESRATVSHLQFYDDDAFLSAGLFKLLCPISYSCMSSKHGGSGMFHQIIMSIGRKVHI